MHQKWCNYYYYCCLSLLGLSEESGSVRSQRMRFALVLSNPPRLCEHRTLADPFRDPPPFRVLCGARSAGRGVLESVDAEVATLAEGADVVRIGAQWRAVAQMGQGEYDSAFGEACGGVVVFGAAARMSLAAV